ncbi:MAG: hypothetical protein ACI8W8_000444 [Rhodothermales bacterium]|jgi:hypothetical protein
MQGSPWSTLPTPRSLALRVLRAFGCLVLGLIIWSSTGIGDLVGSGVHRVSKRIITAFSPPPKVIREEIGRDINGNMQIRTRKIVNNIQPELKNKNYVAIVIALSLIALLSIQSGPVLLSRIAVVAAISAILCLLGTVWHAHYVFALRSQTVGAAYFPTRLEIGLIMACTFYLIPIGSAAGGIWLADRVRTSQLGAKLLAVCAKPAADKSSSVSEPKQIPVSRNADCPCGSGRKYKRCCGSS